MKNNTNYDFFNTLFLKVSVSVSAKVSAISGIGSIGIGICEYLSIGIGGNFGIGAALESLSKSSFFIFPPSVFLLHLTRVASWSDRSFIMDQYKRIFQLIPESPDKVGNVNRRTIASTTI